MFSVLTTPYTNASFDHGWFRLIIWFRNFNEFRQNPHSSAPLWDPLFWVSPSVLFDSTNVSDRNLGVQLRPYSLTNWRSLLNVAFNLSLSCLSVYGLSRLDILHFATFQSRFQHQKPIYGTFLRLSLDIGLPGAFLISRVYYLLFGSRLVLLLDAPCFRTTYKRHHLKAFFLAVPLLCNLNYFLFNWASFQKIVHEPREILNECISFLSMYLVTFAHYLPCVMEHYIQYFSIQRLREIENSIKNGQPNIGMFSILIVFFAISILCTVEFVVIEEVRELALVSNQLHRFLSLPIVVFFFVRVVNGIAVLCLVILNLQNDTVPFLGAALLTWLYVFYLVQLNRQTRNAFDRICLFLHNRHPTLTHKNKWHIFKQWKLFKMTTLIRQRQESEQIRLHGIDIYRSHFQMRILSFIQIDAPFLLEMAAFILNYVVFIYQTN